jgi:branched-chain amino acid transport system permease protein
VNGALLFGQVVGGIVAGAGYAVVAVGLSYTLGLARVMNFAFGTFYMLAAFIAAFLITRYSFSYPLAAIGAVGISCVAGWLFGRLVVLPSIRISEAAVMIATLGVGVVLTNLAQVAFGAEVAFITTPYLSTIYHIGTATVTAQAVIVVIAAPLLTAALSLFMDRTILGRRIKAAAESPDLASATGLNVPLIQTIAVMVGIALAATAAVLYAPVGVIWVYMGDSALLTAFTVTALAGIGRIWGALIVAFGVGIFESLVSGYVPGGYSTAAIYALLVVALIFFPRGLFSGH